MKLDAHIAKLKTDLEGARAALGRETLNSARLMRERDEARANARVLAHAYNRDIRPPQRAVDESLKYPMIPESVRKSAAGPVVEHRRPHHAAALDGEVVRRKPSETDEHFTRLLAQFVHKLLCRQPNLTLNEIADAVEQPDEEVKRALDCLHGYVACENNRWRIL